MKVLFKLWCTQAIIFGLLPTRTPGAEASANRDFTKYAKPPLIILRPVGDAKLYEAAQAKLRSTLWSYWTKREKAIVRVDLGSKYQAPSAKVYFVEPDQAGRWSVAIETEQDRFNFVTRATEHRSLRSRAYSIRRVTDASFREDSNPTRARNYRLILEDAEGRLIEKI